MNVLEEALASGRAAAEELMRETLTLYRPGPGGFDWSTGTETPGSATTVYTGKARVKPEKSEGREVDAAEQLLTLRRFTVSLPWASPMPVRPQPGDVADVATSPDARMVGLRLWVTGVEYSSTATAWRIMMEDRA